MDRFRPWLYRVARNEAFQHLRQNRRWAEAEEPTEAPERADHAEEEFGPADAARIHAALAKLTPPHREILVLRFLEGMSYEEIASVVDCELGTVRSRIHYAKRALRGLLEE